MPKQEITIPKGFDCKNGVCTDKELVIDLELPEKNIQVKEIPQIEIKGTTNGTNSISTLPPIEKVVEKEVEKIVKVVPSYQPNYICKGEKCNTKKNPNYTNPPKGKCSNCGQFTKEGYGTCPWCSSTDIEEMDLEELENLGIPIPEAKENTTDEVD